MVDLCEGMEIGRVNELIQAKMNETGLVTRLIEHGITPKLVRSVYMDHGTPTADIGIRFVKFVDAVKDDCVVGMYHLPTSRIMISRVSFGPGGVPGLTRFAHQMDECKSADDFYEKLPKLLEDYKNSRVEYLSWKQEN